MRIIKFFLCILITISFVSGLEGEVGNEKLRVFVDKYQLSQNKWTTSQEFVERVGKAGFNWYVPRTGGNDLAEVIRVARWAAQSGVKSAVWVRGALENSDENSERDDLLVWENGTVQPLYSPLSPIYRTAMSDLIMNYAEISREMPSFSGVFFDWENYYSVIGRNFYPTAKLPPLFAYSYDAYSLRLFFDYLGLKETIPVEEERAGWLAKRNMLVGYKDFVLRTWRGWWNDLRKKIDLLNPQFQFLNCPNIPGEMTWQAAIPEMGTAIAPVVLADETSYGKRDVSFTDEANVARNIVLLSGHQRTMRGSGFTFLFLGGIDPIARRATPAFTLLNAAALMREFDGYWVFYEGIASEKENSEYFRVFTIVNGPRRPE